MMPYYGNESSFWRSQIVLSNDNCNFVGGILGIILSGVKVCRTVAFGLG